jgi:hypothetical protein
MTQNFWKRVLAVFIIVTSPIWILPYMVGMALFLWFGLAYYDLCKALGVEK